MDVTPKRVCGIRKNKTEEKLWEALPFKEDDPMKKTEKEHPNDSRALEDKGENLRRERSTVECCRNGRES